MVQVWYMDANPEDQQLDNHLSPPQHVDLKTLYKSTGVLYWQLNPETYETDGKLDKLKKDRGYTYTDLIEISKDTLPNFEEKIKNFYREHIHTDEEIRFIIKGAGYFDVRDHDDKWIRMRVTSGDLLVLPAGIYHRFTLDKDSYCKIMRLFVGEPVWTPYDRPADDMEARLDYILQQKKMFSME